MVAPRSTSSTPPQGRVHALLRATQTVVEPLDLQTVLSRIAHAATELVDAEYGAIGVIGPDGKTLERFVFAGLSAGDAERIGHPPEGHGMLGALIADPHPIRLTEVSSDERAVGVPPHHPAMGSFLGVPVWVRGEVFGNLYLANHRSGQFTEEDTRLLEALASTAGYAIDNSRLFAEARMRERWMTAAAELSSGLLSTPAGTEFDLLAARVREVADADRVVVLLADREHRLRVAAVRGSGEDDLQGSTLARDASFAGRVLVDSEPAFAVQAVGEASDPLLVTDGTATGPAMAFPLRARTRLWGVVVAARAPGDAPFTPAEAATAVDLGLQASLALELARAREDQDRELLADDRRRIARDLHDHVIQQLFGTGLGVQAVAAGLGPGEHQEQLGDAVTQLDEAIDQIRTVVFALSHRDEDTVRHRLLDAVAELSSALGRPPTIRFTGPIDHSVTGQSASDVVAAARELLSNAIRHARADRIWLEVLVADGWLSVRVRDDGGGMTQRVRWSGLNNLHERADRHGGSLQVDSSAEGTSVLWRIPLVATAGQEHAR